MYRVYYTNHWYYAADAFATFAAAVEYGKRAGFEFAVHEFSSLSAADDPYRNPSDLVYGWSPIGGARFYADRYRRQAV